MATVDMEKKTFTIDPDELLDIRKHALECAVKAFQGNCVWGDDAKKVIEMAKAFEEHLTRKVGNG